MSVTERLRAIKAHARERNSNYLKYNYIILVDSNNVFDDVFALQDIITPTIFDREIAIYGLGFVGLTLACTLANAGFSVVGIDSNPAVIDKLKQTVAPFYEKGLESMLASLALSNPIKYTKDYKEYSVDTHIVSVGSPLDAAGRPDLTYISAVTTTISRIIKLGDLIVFRSTVPVGTIRGLVLPILESSGLRCGKDFFLSFAPERTVEGNALEELRLLPQIVGGADSKSRELTTKLFQQVTNTVIEVNTLEEAELIKLINNTFRDVIFSFANEVALICDSSNINAFQLIKAANNGYPRDKIPLPSPGVGGICLSKDPILYGASLVGGSTPPMLGRISREINGRGADYVLAKIKHFSKLISKEIDCLAIVIIGLAFKGMPETSDIRASVALDIIEKLPNRDKILVKDFVVQPSIINSLGCHAIEDNIEDCYQNADVILLMNNHYLNNKVNIVNCLAQSERPVLLFDGWNMFDQREIESLPHVYYATMGYMTDKSC